MLVLEDDRQYLNLDRLLSFLGGVLLLGDGRILSWQRLNLDRSSRFFSAAAGR